MNKICTSIEQSQRLIELGIGVNTADMYYSFDYNIEEYEEDAQIIPQSELGQHFSLFPEDIPAWSLTALLGLMPKIHGERPRLDTGRIQTEKYYVEYPYHERTKDDWHSTELFDSAVDAAFEMVCWLLENKKI